MTYSTMLKLLLEGFGTSLLIFFLTLAGSLPLGLLVYFGRESRNGLLRAATRIYISVMRGTPLILQLMVMYYGPYLLFKISLPANWRFAAVVLAFIINYAAYFAEIYRGGILSIDSGQYEAAKVLGYSKVQCFLRIIMPQMFKRSLPAISNEAITLVKDTSIAYVIGYVEMFTRASQIAVAPNTPGMAAFAAAGIIYYIFNYGVAFAMQRIEAAFAYYE